MHIDSVVGNASSILEVLRNIPFRIDRAHTCKPFSLEESCIQKFGVGDSF